MIGNMRRLGNPEHAITLVLLAMFASLTQFVNAVFVSNGTPSTLDQMLIRNRYSRAFHRIIKALTIVKPLILLQVQQHQYRKLHPTCHPLVAVHRILHPHHLFFRQITAV